MRISVKAILNILMAGATRIGQQYKLLALVPENSLL